MGVWAWGLGSKEQKGPRCASCLCSQRAGEPIWEPSRLLGLKWAGKCPPLLSCYSGPGGPLLLASPALPWPPSYAPRTHTAQRGAPEGIGPGQRAKQISLADRAGDTLGVLPLIQAPKGPSMRGNPSPLSATLRGAGPVQLPLFPHLGLPMSYQFAWGFLPSPWVARSATASCGCPSHGET